MLYCSLAAGEQLDAFVTPATEPSNNLYTVQPDKIETPTSGFQFNTSGGSFYFKTKDQGLLEIINNLTLRGWIDTKDNGQLSTVQAQELGLTRVQLSKYQPLSVKNHETPASLHIIQHKQVDSMAFEEEVVLYKEEPLIEYIVRITNTEGQFKYMANMTGGEAAISANYGPLFKKDRLILRRDSKHAKCHPVLELIKGGTTSDVLKPSQGWNRCATYCTTDEGYGLGVIMALSPLWHRWKTGLANFAVPTTTTSSPLPVKVEPNETIEFATAVYAVPPG